jgi:hypothetical protein
VSVSITFTTAALARATAELKRFARNPEIDPRMPPEPRKSGGSWTAPKMRLIGHEGTWRFGQDGGDGTGDSDPAGVIRTANQAATVRCGRFRRLGQRSEIGERRLHRIRHEQQERGTRVPDRRST